ncbi:MAG TPA: DNA recombination protein RmuC [Syntrophobacteria bacterium]|nr:DNA recombination protein RmuC [Syntrophobacteria bacterium]
MNSDLMIAVLVLLAVVVIFQVISLLRRVRIDPAQAKQALQSLEQSLERVERSMGEEVAKNREETANASRQSREELAHTLKAVGDSLDRQLHALTQITDQRLERLWQTLEHRLRHMHDESMQRLDQMRHEWASAAQKTREELIGSLRGFNDSLIKSMTGMAESQHKQMEHFSGQLARLTESNEQRLEGLRTAVEERLNIMHRDNARQLDQMRATVDEKLQGTLEKRLGESFKQVSDRLEQVYRGLGEMQALAAGVGDLKKVLTNVKIRGTWGEVQLGVMLEQVLTLDQYAVNVAMKEGGERVEFAVKLPGRSEDELEVVWLPIDAKFPLEDYQRLVEAQEQGDAERAEDAARQLENRIRQCAGEICRKYLDPPKTTDFGILFLPTEGLFAEVMRRAGLGESVQRQCRVMIAGPTTLWSLLNSLQMGFRTLAIQKRSSEVWNLLAAVKTEWARYGEILDKVQKKLQEASSTIEKAQTRTRAIGRRLKDVEELPSQASQAMLTLEGGWESPRGETEGA